MDDCSQRPNGPFASRQGPKSRPWRFFRRPLAWVILIGVLVVLIAAVVALTFMPDLNYASGYRDGAAAARKDLAQGRAVNLFSGLPRWSEMLDWETGLPNQTTGCAIDPKIEGYVAGYRKTVSDYIAEHGLPPNSRKKWESILFDLQKYYEDRARDGSPEVLRLDGKVVSPDGRTAVRLMIQPATPDIPDAYLVGTVQRGSQKSVEWSAWPLGPENQRLACFWGPDGGDFLILRGRPQGKDGSKFHMYGALDLRSGRWLRYELERASDP